MEKVLPVMLADTEEVEPDLVRQLPFDDDLSKRLGLREQPPASVDGDISGTCSHPVQSRLPCSSSCPAGFTVMRHHDGDATPFSQARDQRWCIRVSRRDLGSD